MENKQKEINEIETKQYRKLTKMENWFCEKINEIDKLLTRLMRKKDTNYQYQERERWQYYKSYRYWKDSKWILWTTIHIPPL